MELVQQNSSLWKKYFQSIKATSMKIFSFLTFLSFQEVQSRAKVYIYLTNQWFPSQKVFIYVPLTCS